MLTKLNNTTLWANDKFNNPKRAGFNLEALEGLQQRLNSLPEEDDDPLCLQRAKEVFKAVALTGKRPLSDEEKEFIREAVAQWLDSYLQQHGRVETDEEFDRFSRMFKDFIRALHEMFGNTSDFSDFVADAFLNMTDGVLAENFREPFAENARALLAEKDFGFLRSRLPLSSPLQQRLVYDLND